MIPEYESPYFATSKQLLVKACEEFLIPLPATRLSLFTGLDKIIGGLRPREFSIFCGSTGSGKTTFMANISHSLLLDGIPHFVASVETGPTDFMKRVISSIVKEDWNQGKKIELERVKQFTKDQSELFGSENLLLSLYEDRFTVEQLCSDITWMHENKKIKIAIIDNLNFFLEVTSAQNQIIEMDRVIHSLIILCKKIDVHLIMIMHPKKTDGTSRVESEFDIKGSSTAVQEAHNIFLWNRPSKDMIDSGISRYARELKIAKMRRMGKVIGMKFLFSSNDGVHYFEEGIIS